MTPLRIEQYVVGMVQTNCYFAINDDTNEMFIVDPGASAEKLAEIIDKEKLNPVAILLTHGHFDHAGAAAELAEHYGIEIYAHEDEQETLENPSINLSGWEGKNIVYHADSYLKDEQVIDVAGFSVRVFHTPGHTVGGCCYYLPEQSVVFSGDTLFAQSVGRTDFPKGSAATLGRSIKDKLMTLSDDVTVYPGHNEITTIGMERVNNPFL